jgi:hypothetical protein
MIPLSIELPLSPRCIRQVVTLFVLQIQSANPEPQCLQDRYPRILSSFVPTLSAFTLGAAVAAGRCVFLFLNRARLDAPREKF